MDGGLIDTEIKTGIGKDEERSWRGKSEENMRLKIRFDGIGENKKIKN